MLFFILNLVQWNFKMLALIYRFSKRNSGIREWTRWLNIIDSTNWGQDTMPPPPLKMTLSDVCVYLYKTTYFINIYIYKQYVFFTILMIYWMKIWWLMSIQ